MLIATGSVKYHRNVHAKQGIRRECLNRFNGTGGYCSEKIDHPRGLEFSSVGYEIGNRCRCAPPFLPKKKIAPHTPQENAFRLIPVAVTTCGVFS